MELKLIDIDNVSLDLNKCLSQIELHFPKRNVPSMALLYLLLVKFVSLRKSQNILADFVKTRGFVDFLAEKKIYLAHECEFMHFCSWMVNSLLMRKELKWECKEEKKGNKIGPYCEPPPLPLDFYYRMLIR